MWVYKGSVYKGRVSALGAKGKTQLTPRPHQWMYAGVGVGGSMHESLVDDPKSLLRQQHRSQTSIHFLPPFCPIASPVSNRCVRSNPQCLGNGLILRRALAGSREDCGIQHLASRLRPRYALGHFPQSLLRIRLPSCLCLCPRPSAHSARRLLLMRWPLGLPPLCGHHSLNTLPGALAPSAFLLTLVYLP